MKRFILISATIELLAGIVLFFAPQVVPDLAQGPGSHMAMGRMYGVDTGIPILFFDISPYGFHCHDK